MQRPLQVFSVQMLSGPPGSELEMDLDMALAVRIKLVLFNFYYAFVVGFPTKGAELGSKKREIFYVFSRSSGSRPLFV